jgi:hypothetical protein
MAYTKGDIASIVIEPPIEEIILLFLTGSGSSNTDVNPYNWPVVYENPYNVSNQRWVVTHNLNINPDRLIVTARLAFNSNPTTPDIATYVLQEDNNSFSVELGNTNTGLEAYVQVYILE